LNFRKIIITIGRYSLSGTERTEADGLAGSEGGCKNALIVLRHAAILFGAA
jgi:hypothetical protein